MPYMKDGWMSQSEWYDREASRENYERDQMNRERFATGDPEPRGEGPPHVYVVTANVDEQVAVQKVFANCDDAHREYLRLVDLYGGTAVCLASRYVHGALRGEAQGEEDDFNPLTDPLPEHEAERVERVLSRADEIARLTAELEEARERERKCREVLVNVRDALIVLDESRQQWVRWLVDSMNAVTECRTLRTEEQGAGWQVTEPARDIVRREMPETRATVREAIRAARQGEGGE